MLQYDKDDIFQPDKWDTFESIVQVYVKVEIDSKIEQHREDLHKSLGGQVHVKCSCSGCPLIPSGKMDVEKERCMKHDCNRRESFVCPKLFCRTKFCAQCFNKFDSSSVTMVNPPAPDFNGNVEIDDMSESSDEASHQNLYQDMQATRLAMEDFVNGDDDYAEFLTRSNYDAVDDAGRDNDPNVRISMPHTEAGDLPVECVHKKKSLESVPCHVILNQVGTLCTRYKHDITGTRLQQNFIQKIVSNVKGRSMPLLSPSASLFPRHFYAQARHDPGAILGANPLCTYTNVSTKFGFCSQLINGRSTLNNHASSTSSDPSYVSFIYDILANLAANNIDSRLIQRHGFRVHKKKGIGVRGSNEDFLHEGVDSHQMAMNIAATQLYVEMDYFITLTLNQRKHPGIAPLFAFKESGKWKSKIRGYYEMTEMQQKEVERSYGNSYMFILSRCWNEVAKMVIDFLIEGQDSCIRDVLHAVVRREFQEELMAKGNVEHYHALFAVKKRNISPATLELLQELVRSDVLSLIETKKIPEYIDKGLMNDFEEWFELTDLAGEILTHKCSDRCQMRIGEDKFRCRKIHPVFGRENPMENELVDVSFKFSEETMDALEWCGLYQPPDPGGIGKGSFTDDMFKPARHFGRVHPLATCNMSPTIGELFLMTKSMCNVQVLTGTNGCARYLAKYLAYLDKNKEVVFWADAKNALKMNGETNFLHNTKISTSKYNEEKAKMKSRGKDHPRGRAVPVTEMLQLIQGYPDVMTTFKFVGICTKPYEMRATTLVKLNHVGALLRPDKSKSHDVQSTVPAYEIACARKNIPLKWRLTDDQKLLFKCNGVKSNVYDKVTEFGFRPPIFLKMFRLLGNYFRWFFIDKKKVLSPDEICSMLDPRNPLKSPWIDAIGRIVKVRRKAFPEIMEYLQTLDAWGREDSVLWDLEDLLYELSMGRGNQHVYVCDDNARDLPVPVYSSVVPTNTTAFILHMLLVLGSFETEMDFRMVTCVRDAFINAGLINEATDPASLEHNAKKLARLAITKVLKLQPVPMRRLNEFVPIIKNLFQSIMMNEEYPSTELPPCLLTSVLDSHDKELQDFWEQRKTILLDALEHNVGAMSNAPTREAIMKATISEPIPWDLSGNFVPFQGQNETSFNEQHLAISVGERSIKKYMTQFGVEATLTTKGTIIEGAAGGGKSFTGLTLVLFAMSQGLRVMSTALMSTRAIGVGGIHRDKLFGLPFRKSGSIHRIAEVAIDKLLRKTNLKHLHCLLTVDVLFIDELGQWSAQEFSVLDVIFRNLRRTTLPFGGVHIIATMDHKQLGEIQGLPLLMNTYILTHFHLIRLTKSVRARADVQFQLLQDYTRMSPNELLSNPEHEKEFKRLAKQTLTIVQSWDDEQITSDVIRMYARKKPAKKASHNYIDSCIREFRNNNIPFITSTSEDYEKIHGSRSEYKQSHRQEIKDLLNHGMKEPEILLFFTGAYFEATVNVEGQYSQSQILYMLDIPTIDDIKHKRGLCLWASPSGYNTIDTTHHLTLNELQEQKWTKVRVGLSRETVVTSRNIMAKRKQYALKHFGYGTINAQMGNTILGKGACHFSKSCSPWSSNQVVVILTRTTIGKNTILVTEGDTDWAIDKMWSLLTTKTHWTDHVDQLLDRLSLNNNIQQQHNTPAVDFTETFPYRTHDIALPNDTTGYIYLLASIRNLRHTYVGQTDCIARRFREHNSGNGAQGTEDPIHRPWCVASYICGLDHMSIAHRVRLEWLWQSYIRLQIQRGNDSIEARINQGERIVEEYNQGFAPEHFFFGWLGIGWYPLMLDLR